ncbi:MAG: hypothetical protein AB8B53_02745 [Flavobacteriales bacterium]
MTYMIELTKKKNQRFSDVSYHQHKLVLQDLISEGIVLNYAESTSKEKFWIIIEADSEAAAIDYISDLNILSALKLSLIPIFTNVSNLSEGVVYSLN